MSSFIVSSKTINQIVSFLDNMGHSPETWAYSLRDLMTKYKLAYYEEDFCAKMASELLKLNETAVYERYGDASVLTMPGECFETLELRTSAYEYRREEASYVQVYKDIQCLHYQCCEGNVPKNPLYKFLGELGSALSEAIVSHSSEYENATWDA